MHTVETVRGSHVRLFEDDAVKCNSCGREGVIQTFDGIATVLWETDEERAEGAAMTNNQLTRERLEKIKSWRETYGAGSNVMLPAEEAEELARMALAAMDSEPVYQVEHDDDTWSDVEEEEMICADDKGYEPRLEWNGQSFTHPVTRGLWRMYQAAPTGIPVNSNGWIPVSERLPEDSGRYWCYVEEQNDLGKSHYQWNCSWNGDRWWVESEGGGIVTHWMPLPAAPQEVKSES